MFTYLQLWWFYFMMKKVSFLIIFLKNLKWSIYITSLKIVYTYCTAHAIYGKTTNSWLNKITVYIKTMKPLSLIMTSGDLWLMGAKMDAADSGAISCSPKQREELILLSPKHAIYNHLTQIPFGNNKWIGGRIIINIEAWQ